MAESRRERKIVTVLFADLVGFTARAEELDPEDVEAILVPYQERLRAELERFGGTVEKFIGDAVMALFGAPVAHEDDPERAVRAGLAIRDWAREGHEVQVRIAVNTGEALVRVDARPDVGETMATGDVMNTTARLQSAAPVNGVLVGETTYRATRSAIDFREAEPVEAKGKAEPITVWEALQPRARLGVDVAQPPRAVLVGRGREVGLLRDMLARVRHESSPQLVTIVGVPGIGKSRLVYELFHAIEEDGVLTYWRQGRSLPYGDGVTYWALAEMVKAQAGILETDGDDEVKAKLASCVADLDVEIVEREWLETHLRPLAGLGGEAEPGGESRTEAFAAWRRFFEAMADKRPLVLVFEDLHWADDGLLDFVDHLVEWGASVPMLVVCTARPELLERRPGWGGGKLNATTLSISALSDTDTSRLLGSLLDRRLLEAEQQQTLLARAGGNPLYAEQFAHMLLERGSVADLPLPESVQGIIAARLDRLPADEKALLQDAAVHGKVFWAGALTDGHTPEDAARSLHGLERKGFVQRARRSSVGNESEFAFLHLLVRDVAYGQIPRADRAAKHLHAAGWIESLGRREDHAEMLAHHYRSALDLMETGRAEIPSKVISDARAAIADAGERALSLNSFAAAARFYEEALDLAGDEPPARAELEYKRALSLFGMGDARRIDTLEQARDSLLEAGARQRAAVAEALVAEAWWLQGRHDLCMEHLGRAEELIADASPSPEKARVLIQVSRFQMLGDRNEESIRTAAEALDLIDRFSLDELRIHMLATVGTARCNMGDLDGMADLERAIELAAGNPSAALWRAYNNLAVVVDFAYSDHARCLELHQQGLRIAERFGDVPQMRWFHGQIVYDKYWLGDFDAALREADRVIAEVEAGMPHSEEIGSRSIRARIRLARGDEDGAVADIDKAIRRARESTDPQATRVALASAAFVAIKLGRLNEAGALADELLSRIPRGTAVHTALLPLAEVLVALGRREEFLAALEPLTPCPLLHAVRAYAAGDLDEAADLLICVSPQDEAYVRLEAAAAHSNAGRRGEADAQLQRALSFWHSVGATRYIREAETLLAATA
jgi:class 3 adenylate cyclase/tetratricopeptide (TPR) repeat protein